MRELIKLELRRNNLRPYVWGSFGIFLFVLIMGVFFCALPMIDPDDADIAIMSDFHMIIAFLSVLSMSSFAILGTVMHAKLTIEEYTGRKNVLLFTYPQKRSQILFAKFVLVFGFVFIAMTVSNILALLLTGLIGNIMGLFSQALCFDNIMRIFVWSILPGVTVNLISMISLRIGFAKKSVIWAIVSAVVLITPFGNSAISFHNLLLPVFCGIGLLLLVICAFLFFGLLKKVNEMECL